MARPGKTTARGYGAAHQKLAARLLAQWHPGQPCARCGQPMWQRWTRTPAGRRVSAIELGHTDDRTAYTGLEHAHCNRSAGAIKRNATRRVRFFAGQVKSWPQAVSLRTSRRW